MGLPFRYSIQSSSSPATRHPWDEQSGHSAHFRRFPCTGTVRPSGKASRPRGSPARASLAPSALNADTVQSWTCGYDLWFAYLAASFQLRALASTPVIPFRSSKRSAFGAIKVHWRDLTPYARKFQGFSIYILNSVFGWPHIAAGLRGRRAPQSVLARLQQAAEPHRQPAWTRSRRTPNHLEQLAKVHW